MTSNAKEEKDLKRMQQRLQILAPLIQDVHNACFNLGKFFVTILVAIHGGAIGIVVTSGDDRIMDSIAFFIMGLVFAMVIILVLIFTINITISNYTNNIVSDNFDINRTLDNVNSLKKVFYILIYFLFSFSFSFFFSGVDNLCHIKFNIYISDIIQQIFITMIIGIKDNIVIMIDFISPFLLLLCIAISFFSIWYKKYRLTIERTANWILKKFAKIIKQILLFLWIRAVLLSNRAVDFIQNYKHEYLSSKSTK